MAAHNTCAGCLQKILNREFLICSICNNYYDLECANISTQRFYNTLNKEHREKWKCPLCKNKLPKKDNTNTPIRPQQPLTTEQNVTLRNKKYKANQLLSSSEEDVSNIPGDTISFVNSPPRSLEHELQTETIFEKLKQFISDKLERNNRTLVYELKSLIKSEISSAITEFKLETTEKLRNMNKSQETLYNEISKINNKIKLLEIENQNLQKQIREFEKSSNNISSHTSNNVLEEKKIENYRKIVLYGLQENYWESDDELHERIIWIFQEILRVDLTGYIEDLKRVGKQGYARPLIIELLSKQKTKYILNYRYLFKNTGLAISEYLDQKSLLEKRNIRKALMEARRQGKHAVLRNGTLIINGSKQFQSSVPEYEYYTQNNSNQKASVQKTNLRTPIRNESQSSVLMPTETQSIRNHTFRV
jgi:hypothetical protein